MMTEKILRVATEVAACSLACAAAAQNYPAKPVRVIVPFPPAGAADIVARHASNALSEAFGVQFVVENRSGAGGAIGGEAAPSIADIAARCAQVVLAVFNTEQVEQTIDALGKLDIAAGVDVEIKLQ